MRFSDLGGLLSWHNIRQSTNNVTADDNRATRRHENALTNSSWRTFGQNFAWHLVELAAVVLVIAALVALILIV